METTQSPGKLISTFCYVEQNRISNDEDQLLSLIMGGARLKEGEDRSTGRLGLEPRKARTGVQEGCILLVGRLH